MYVRIIKNNWIPNKDYEAMTIWPFIFTRMSFLPQVTLNHEKVHCAQQMEMLALGAMVALFLFIIGCGWWSLLALPMFFYWYGIEWGIRYVLYRDGWEAYRNIAFEQEAYLNQQSETYLCKREYLAWVVYLVKKTFKK